MVSRPAFSSVNPNGKGTVNMMTTQETPGSVFKTVTAAAAIDYGLVPPSRTIQL